MKKGMAVLTAFSIGIICCSMETAAIATQGNADWVKESDNPIEEFVLEKTSQPEIDWEKAFQVLNESASGDPKIGKEDFGLEKTKTQAGQLKKEEEKQSRSHLEEREEAFGLKSLQMPQKLEVVIDPWETDGKGQVYSEQYVIRNMGGDTGILTLSGLACKSQENSGAVVRTDPYGIHEDECKSIYMEMLFGNGEQIVLSEEGAVYETELKPGEELSLQFAGEVNEYASRSWDNEDIAVRVVYSWDRKEEAADTSGDILNTEEAGAEKTNLSGDVSGDIPTEDPEKMDVSGDAEKSDAGDGWEKEEETIDLDVSGDAKIESDSWTVSADGKTATMQYVLWNAGNTPGTLLLSEPVCKGMEKIVLIAGTERDEEGSQEEAEDLDSKGKKYISVELLPKDEEEAVAGKEEFEKSEDSWYQAELKPGEELVIRFSVNLDGMETEDLKEGKISVTAEYSWILEGVEVGHDDELSGTPVK